MKNINPPGWNSSPSGCQKIFELGGDQIEGLPIDRAAKKLEEILEAALGKPRAVSVISLRKWNNAGLVSSTRTQGGHRRFSLEALQAFASERRLKRERKQSERRAP